MSGTYEGGRKAAQTNKQRYGKDFYKVIGGYGGSLSREGGFAKDRELARAAGRKGGGRSRRTSATCPNGHSYVDNVRLITTPGGSYRQCLICHKAAVERSKQRQLRRVGG